MRLFAVLVALTTLTASAPIPGELQGIYAELDAQITRFDAVIGARWNGRTSPVAFSTELLPANGHVGADLLRPQQMDMVKLTLDRLQSLGVGAVTVQVSFPILYRPFFRSDEEFTAYLDFYRRLAQEVRSRNLKLIVKTQALFSKGGWTGLDVARFYRGLTLDEYVQGRAQVALTIAREMRPDFLSVVMEPDTEADQTGLPMNTPANSVRVVRAVLEQFTRAGISGVKVGAGTGTWHPQYEAFHAYVDYEAAKSLTTQQLVALSTQAAGKALVAGEFTRTGTTYKTLISSGPGSSMPSQDVKVIAPNGGRVAWSHTRNLIAFDRTGAGGTFDIHTIRPDGTGTECLTCDQAGLPRSHRGNPAWHPSGEYIVFQAHDPRLQTGRRIEGYLGTPGLGINNDIWVMTADGKRAWPLTHVSPGEGVLHPHFSHTGRQLLWSEIIDPTVRGMGGQWVIRLADFSTEAGAPAVRNIRTLRPGNLQLYETHGFSPDDRWLLFSASPRGGDYYDLEIYAYEAASGKLLRLTRNDEWDEHAQFTEDGRHIVWASSEAIPQRKEPRDLRLDYWIMNADGSGKRRLTNFNEPGSPGFRPNTLVADFEFGPDGKTIVAKMGAAGRGETVVLIRLLD